MLKLEYKSACLMKKKNKNVNKSDLRNMYIN